MDDKQIKRLEKLEKQKKKQLERQKKFASENYDRIAFVLPKGSREKIRDFYRTKGLESLADIFKYLLKQDGFILEDGNPETTQENHLFFE